MTHLKKGQISRRDAKDAKKNKNKLNYIVFIEILIKISEYRLRNLSDLCGFA
jgi:hypothetical protein